MLAALCIEWHKKQWAEWRAKSPSGGKVVRQHQRGGHFQQAQPGLNVFHRAKGAVVWFYHKRRLIRLKWRPLPVEGSL